MIFLILLNLNLLCQDITPPGTLKIGDFYVDKTEILNIHWLEYQYYLKQQLDEAEHWKITPNSNNNWYQLPSRRYEPVALISYEQALDYCKWRSEFVSDKLGIHVLYRLPTIAEWNSIAETIVNENEKKTLKSLSKIEQKLENRKGEYYLFSRKSPNNALYDFFSNVSEMTATKGIAKGGSNHELYEAKRLTVDVTYNRPNPYLGFRCIAEIRNATDR